MDSFHKNAGMADGRLNKCSSCVVKAVSLWRQSNKKARQAEYQKRREKLGITKTFAEYSALRKQNAKGRKAVCHEYDSKRRVRKSITILSEFDLLVQAEAVHLRVLREQITKFAWHVDHIVPLQHKAACGLHNGYNLQVVPADWNVKKGNRNMNEYFCKGKE